jgi:hypothetical protein
MQSIQVRIVAINARVVEQGGGFCDDKPNLRNDKEHSECERWVKRINRKLEVLGYDPKWTDEQWQMPVLRRRGRLLQLGRLYERPLPFDGIVRFEHDGCYYSRGRCRRLWDMLANLKYDEARTLIRIPTQQRFLHHFSFGSRRSYQLPIFDNGTKNRRRIATTHSTHATGSK